MAGEPDVPCRVCGRSPTRIAGSVEYLRGYAWIVRDCDLCGCRFTRHDPQIHDRLHRSGALSYYGDYQRLQARCGELFARGDAAGLKQLLFATPKYRYVLERLAALPPASRLLEVGCSRGYLTSSSILAGRDIIGVDASPDAIAAARRSFGDRFMLAGSPAIAAHGPYDAIYHVGLIGCVSDPIGLTRQLLSWLKPGGRLFFNAPNRAALMLRGQLWLDSAPPPDLVTLFPPGFWTRELSGTALVTESIETLPPMASVAVGLRMMFRRAWAPPVPQPLDAGAAFQVHSGLTAGFGWRAFESFVTRVARVTGLERLAGLRPAEFGLWVELTAR